MFTGIVEELGEVADLRLSPDGGDARVTVRGPVVTGDVGIGDSISVSGVCLTVVSTGPEPGTFDADVMHETLSRTTAGTWRAGSRVNLERSVTPTTRMGGHLVQGHVDGVGVVVDRAAHPGYDELSIRVSTELGRYLAGKGAVAVDGVSLTVIDVTDESDGTVFTLGIIPQTRTVTTLGTLKIADRVNVEADVMAKYAERLLADRVGAFR
jgi:riboflavin synthase